MYVHPFSRILLFFPLLFLMVSMCYADAPRQRKIDEVFDFQGRLFSQTDLFSDKYNGFYKTFHPNGQLATEVRYKDGWEIFDKAFDAGGWPIVREGTVVSYYANGRRASQGEYRNDLKQGAHKYYFYDGNTVVDVWHYMDGRRVGAHIRNDNNGNFIYQEDWGYPSSYVLKLKQIIAGLTILLILCLIVVVIKYFNRRRSGENE